MEASSYGGGGKGVNFQACRQRTKGDTAPTDYDINHEISLFLSLSFRVCIHPFAISMDKEGSPLDRRFFSRAVDVRYSSQKGILAREWFAMRRRMINTEAWRGNVEKLTQGSVVTSDQPMVGARVLSPPRCCSEDNRRVNIEPWKSDSSTSLIEWKVRFQTLRVKLWNFLIGS